MSIDGLGSIIESEDNIRFVDDQISNYAMLHGPAVLPAPVDDKLTFNDADENYDTDLEEDFPGNDIYYSIKRLLAPCIATFSCQMNRRAKYIMMPVCSQYVPNITIYRAANGQELDSDKAVTETKTVEKVEGNFHEMGIRSRD